MGPFDAWPSGGGGFEHFYGFIGGETNQYAPAIYDGTVPVEPDRSPEEGYHFTEDMTDRAIDWIRQQKALMPDKPFFAYFAPGATHAPHHVPIEWSDKYKGKFDQGWDALREETLRAPEGARRDPARGRADRAPGGDPGLGRHARRPQAGARAPDGGLCRLPRAHRPPRRPARGRARGARGARRHADLLHRRRQRRLRRGHAAGDVQRDHLPERRGRYRDHRVHGLAHRRVRHRRGQQPLRRRLGARDGHALPVDQAGRLALGRDPQRDRRALAARIRVTWRAADPVQPRDRRRGDRAGRGGAARADLRARRAADAAARPEHGADLRRRGGARAPRDAVLRDVRQPRHLPQGLDRGHAPQHPVEAHRDARVRRRRVGALRARGLDPGARPGGRPARQAARAAAAVPDRGGPLQRAAARRPPLRALQPGHRRAAAADRRASPSCCSAAWDGCRRTRCSSSRTSRTR